MDVLYQILSLSLTIFLVNFVFSLTVLATWQLFLFCRELFSLFVLCDGLDQNREPDTSRLLENINLPHHLGSLLSPRKKMSNIFTAYRSISVINS